MKTSIYNSVDYLRQVTFIMVIITMFCMPNLKAQSYAILNASSTPGVNGIYSEDGSCNGNPKYTNGSYTLFYADHTMKWAIVPNGTNLTLHQDYSTSPFRYSTKRDDNTPPAKGWHQGGNSTGLPGEYIIVTPLNSIGYNKYNFLESLADDGTIKDTLLICLYADGISFTGSSGDDFISDNKAVFTNIPSGLTASIIRISDSTLVAYLEGTADDHAMIDNTDSLKLSFNNSSVSNNDISFIDNSEMIFKIIYQSAYKVSGANSYPGVGGLYKLVDVFNEKPAFKKDNYYLMAKDCRPKWIIRNTSSVHPMYSTHIKSYLPYNRQWYKEFFTIADNLTVGMSNSIVYTSYTFIESEVNDGSFNDSLAITYNLPANGSTFSGNNGDDFIANDKLLISNLPDGLTATARKFNDTTIYLKLEGQETDHDAEQNIENLNIEFTEEAFTGQGIFATNNFAFDSINVVHMEQYILVDTTNFCKEVNGLYNTYDWINHAPAYRSRDDYYLVRRNTPEICIWTVLKGGLGTAFYRTPIDGNHPPYEGWYIGGTFDGDNPASIEIFPAQPWLAYCNMEFNESGENQGTIADTMRISLNHSEEILFTGEIGEDFYSNAKIELQNIPEGLNPSVIKRNDTLLYVILSGTAVNHEPEDNVNNIIVRFADNAFNETADHIKFTDKYRISISYNSVSGKDDIDNSDLDLLIYPNPAQKMLIVEYQGIDPQIYYKLLDLSGKIIIHDRLKNNSINVSKVPKGVYVLVLEVNGEIKIKKVIIP